MGKATFWGAWGLLLTAGVGAGFYPGWRMERELRAAGEDGLATVPPPLPDFPGSKNARPDYQEAVRRHPNGVRVLFTTPNKPDAEVEALAQAFTRIAAEKPHYWTKYAAYQDDVIATVARYVARTAKDEAGLAGAARIARSLATLRDLSGTTYWAKAAEGVLDGADRLRLPPSARTRLLAVLGPPIDPREELRHHMIDVLGKSPGWSPTASWTDRFQTFRQRKEFRYIAAWRTFWRSAPPDVPGFAQALGDAEEGLAKMEWAMGRRDAPPATFGASRRPLSVWYAKLAALRARMQA